MHRGGTQVERSQITISASYELMAAIRFAAMRDGLAPSTKARQILTQALRRTMDSAEFQQHWDAIKDTGDQIAEATT